MKKIKRLDSLRTSELERIRATLRQRFGADPRGNIVEIAFGVAEKFGRVDPSRPDAICFYVRRKRMPRAKADRIPQHIEVRIRRGRQFYLVCLPTDVIEIGPREIQPTGRRVRDLRRTDHATTGSVVAWRLGGETRFTWGLICVGHFFWQASKLPETIQQVRINSATTPIHRFRGTLLARTVPFDGSQSDAALILVERSSLVRANFISQNQPTTGKRISTVEDLRRDRNRAGFTYPYRTQIPFEVLRFLPVSVLVEDLGPIKHVIEARSPTANAFGRGRSGSAWVIRRQVASMQHGGLPASFIRGWGQSLETVLKWTVKRIATLNGVAQRDVELRLIKVV